MSAAGCAALHTLNLQYCRDLTDVSALASCAALHTLHLEGCGWKNTRPCAYGQCDVNGVSALLAGCATLRTLNTYVKKNEY